MTSKEALSDLSFLAIGDENHTIKCKEIIEKDLDRLESLERENELLKKDLKEYQELYKRLEILECFKKIDKKELKDFIEAQIRYALNENTWLSACNCNLEKEKPTKHLIKIKEWLENE